MRVGRLIVLLCLFAMGVEITIDPSTAFVRSGTQASQQDHAPKTLDTPAHTACPLKIEPFYVFFSSTRLETYSMNAYIEPTLLLHQRPPIS